MVDIELRTCSCRKWKLCGIPCAHAVAVMGLDGKNPEDYVDPCYKKESFLRAYEPIINPVNGPNNKPKLGIAAILSPQDLKMPGRPKSKRRKELGEGRKEPAAANHPKKLSKKVIILKCSSCKETGHNARKCPTSQPSEVEGRNVETSITLARRDNDNRCGKCKRYGYNKRSCKVAASTS